MAKYKVKTSQGTFMVTASDGAPQSGLDGGISDTIQQFGQGAAEGATAGGYTVNNKGDFELAQQEPKAIPGSILNEKGGVNQTFSDKYSVAKGAGRLVGSVIPMVASELAAGAAAGPMALKFGMGPVLAAMNKMGLTFAAYEGMRDTAANKPPTETLGNVPGQYLTGMVFGAAAHGAGKLMEAAPEALANQYLKTPARIADSQFKKGKPSLGRSYLDETTHGIGTSKGENYKDIAKQLEQNRMVIQDKLRRADELLQTPSVPPVEIEGTPQLEYKPSETQVADPQAPAQMKLPGGRKAGERVMIDPKFQTTQPGGAKYDTLAPGTGVPLDYSGRGFDPTFPKSNVDEVAGQLQPQPTHMAGYAKRGGIDLNEMRSAAGSVRAEQADIGNIMGEIGVAPGEGVVSNQRAYELLTHLDAQVNKAYSSIDPNAITPADEARAAMANKLRELLRNSVPEVSELLGKNHNLMMFESALLPQLSGRAMVSEGGDWFKPAIAKSLGSRAGLGVARAIEAVTPEAGMPVNSARTAGAIGVSDTLEKYRNKKDKPNAKR